MKKYLSNTLLLFILMTISSVLVGQNNQARTKASGFIFYPSGEKVSRARINQAIKNTNAPTSASLKTDANNPPVANNDTVYICMNSSVTTIYVQNNDSDPDGNSLSTNIYAGTINGSFSLNGNAIDYTPNIGYIGTDTLVYYVCDNGTPSLCDTATVFIHVVPGFTTTKSTSFCSGDSLLIGGVYTTVAGIFTQTLTATGGCDSVVITTVTITPSPTVTISSTSPTICAGGATTLTASGATNYSWSPATGLSATTGSMVVASPTNTATYMATGTSGSCSDTQTITVTVIPSPTVTITSTSSTICAGGSTTLTANGATSYTWSPTTGLSATTGSMVIANPANTTTYTASGTNGTCSNTQIVVITVMPSPTVTINSTSPTICAGGSTTLTANGASSYTWSPATGLSATTGSMVVANPTNTTTYTATGSNGTCSYMQTTIVTVTPSPTVTIASTSSMICAGGSTTLTANGATTYSWSPATGLSATTGSMVVANPTNTTTYTVTGTSGTCSDMQTTVVTVTPSPTVTITSTSSTICTGGSTTLTANGATNYAWSPATGLSATTGSMVVANPTSTTTYTVSGTSGTCSDMQTTVVTVTPPPTASITSSGATTFCQGNSVTLSANNGTAYSWSTGATTQSINVTSSGTYSVMVSNACGSTNSTPITITVNPSPTVAVTQSGATTFCQGGSVTLTSSTANSYSWSTGATTQTISVNSSGNYSVLVTDANNCSSTSIATSVTVNQIPTSSFTYHSTSLTNYSFTNTSANATTYFWNFGNGQASTSTNPTTVYSSTGTYVVTLIASNTCGSDTSKQTIETLSDFIIYNGFSPNGDGHNDTWNIPALNYYADNNVKILNRWGSEVWQGDNYNNQSVIWTGKNMVGDDLPDGTYYYIISYDNIDKRGWVIIKR